VKDGAGVKDRLLDRDVEFAAKCGRILIIVGRRGSSKTNGKKTYGRSQRKEKLRRIKGRFVMVTTLN